MPTYAVMIPTWRCNRACLYCDYTTTPHPDGGYDLHCYGGTHRIPQERGADWWLRNLERLAPYHLALSGGEPMLYEGLPDLVAGLPEGCSWAVTTALPRLDVDYTTCKGVTVSYHEQEGAELAFWAARIRSVPCDEVRITLVAQRGVDQRPVIDRIHELTGKPTNIHPVCGPGIEWTPDDWARVQALHDPPHVVVVGTIPDTWTRAPRYDVCHVGERGYLALGPDGRAYQCYHHMVYGIGGTPLPLWEPNPALRCGRGCVFPCDRDARPQ